MAEDNTRIIASTPTKAKEFSAPPVQCLMQTETNYTVWAMRMKILLKIYKVWDTIEDEDKNNTAIGLIFQAIPEHLILQIGEQSTSKAIWDSLKT